MLDSIPSNAIDVFLYASLSVYFGLPRVGLHQRCQDPRWTCRRQLSPTGNIPPTSFMAGALFGSAFSSLSLHLLSSVYCIAVSST